MNSTPQAEPAGFHKHLPRRILFFTCLLLAHGCFPDLSPLPAAPPAADAFPSPVTGRLTADLKIVTTESDWRRLAARIQSQTGLPVVFDRRLDPLRKPSPNPHRSTTSASATSNSVTSNSVTQEPLTQEPLTQEPLTLGPSVSEALDQVAQLAGAEWSSDGTVVFLGPADSVDALATHVVLTRQQIAANPAAVSRGWLQSRPIAWPLLTTPDEALQQVADSWGISREGVTLPHDLWPATDLGELDLAAALAVVGGGFDLLLEPLPTADRLRSKTLGRPAAPYQRTYPGLAIDAETRREIVAQTANLRKQQNVWVLRGDAKAHLRMELALFAQQAQQRRGAQRPAAGQPMNEPAKRYSLRFAGSARQALTSLCAAEGFQLQVAAAAEAALEQRIELEAKDETIEQLIQRVATEVGVSLKTTGKQVTVE